MGLGYQKLTPKSLITGDTFWFPLLFQGMSLLEVPLLGTTKDEETPSVQVFDSVREEEKN